MEAGDGEELRVRDCERERGEGRWGCDGASCRVEMSCRSSLISDRSCATSELLVGVGVAVADGAGGEVMDATVG